MPSTTLVVARRELAEKRFVFIAAIAFVLLSILIPMTVLTYGSFRESLAMTSTVLATV